MTTQNSTVPRRLRRRSDERVLGGVASGIGDYFNVDPILIRILLVASLVFGGLGIFLYVVAWLVVPDEASDTSIAERVLGGGGVLAALLIAILAVVAISVVFGIATPIAGPLDGPFGGPFRGPFERPYFDGGPRFPGLLIALLVIGVGAYLLRRRGPDAGASASAVAPDAAGAVDETAPQIAAAPLVRRERRPASPLGWYAVGAALVGIGLLALATSAFHLATEPAHYFGIIFGAVASALVIGAFWGHARFLILIGILLLPIAWAASLVDVPIRGAWGSLQHRPASAADVRDEYRVAGGDLLLDLTRVTESDEPIEIHASVAMGELRVRVPQGATVEVDASVGGGVVWLLDSPAQDGTRLEASEVVDGADPHFILDLDAGLGAIRVDAIHREGI